MNMWNLNLLAQAGGEAAEGGGAAPRGLESFLGGPGMMLILFIVIFYFLLIRPQRMRQKKHDKMVSELKTGDRVVISGGIHGTIANLKDRTVIVKIAENTKIEVERSNVSAVLQEPAA